MMAIVERYLSLRRNLGFKLRDTAYHLRSYAKFADSHGESHIRTATAMLWAGLVPSANLRRVRYRNLTNFARFAHAEDDQHEVPANSPFTFRTQRRTPYIYSRAEIRRLVDAAGKLAPQSVFPMRPMVYSMLFGLIAATGLRVHEALSLRLSDVHAGGILHIRETKFGKSRYVPLHPTTVAVLERYLDKRRQMPIDDDHLFVSASARRLAPSIVNYTFRNVLRAAGIKGAGGRPPRIHDLRHAFATRALERCSTQREAVSRHFVAISTYLGHAEIASTYWYFEATSQLMKNIASVTEALLQEEQS